MDNATLPKPWVYKEKWLIWPKVVLDFVDIIGCNDTINGICTIGKSITECLDTCVKGCAAGYHIQFSNGESICVPILTSLHPHLNPVYRLRNQNIYPNLSNVTVSTFINTKVFPFPPNYGNAVFYRDILSISLVSDPLTTIGTSTTENSDIYIEKNHNDNIQLVLAEKIVEKIAYYVPVQYGDNIVLLIPGTSLIATVDINSGDLSWKAAYTTVSLPNSTFTILPAKPGKKPGDVVAYGDPIILSYQDTDMFLVKNPVYNNITIEYENLSNIIKNPNALFTLQSKMTGWYCQNNMCKSVPIKNITKNGVSGTYNGAIVDRNNACWGTCNDMVHLRNIKYFSSKKSWLIPLVITFSIITSILVITWYIRHRSTLI